MEIFIGLAAISFLILFTVLNERKASKRKAEAKKRRKKKTFRFFPLSNPPLRTYLTKEGINHKKAREHPSLKEYLKEKGVNHKVARKYLYQIEFYHRDINMVIAYAVGYPAGNGFLVCNTLFEGFVGKEIKVTFHEKVDASLLLVFGGFMDFLIYLTMKKADTPEGAVLVLNRSSLWRQALPYLQDERYRDIRLYLDNNSYGTAATSLLIQNAGRSCIQDMRSDYEEANEWALLHVDGY